MNHPWLISEAPQPTSIDMMPIIKSKNQEIEEEAEEAAKEKLKKNSVE